MVWPTSYLFSMIYRPLLLLLLATVAGSTVGCAAKLQSVLIGSLMEDVATATARHDDPELVATGVPTFLLLLEGLLEANPNDQKLLLSAAEAYTSYATLIESDNLPRARRLYRRAKEYGIRALPPQQAQLLQSPIPNLPLRSRNSMTPISQPYFGPLPVGAPGSAPTPNPWPPWPNCPKSSR